MIDQNELYNKFSTFSFVSYAKAVRSILSAYKIVNVTIDKITDKINNGECGPFYVYRRAVIICNDSGAELQISNQSYGSMPLIIVLQPSVIVLHNNQIGKIECKYENLCDYLEYLKPLYSWDVNKSDHYQTLEFEVLVEQLYRELKLNDNEENDIRNFIFSLLYIAHFRSLLKLDDITEELNVYSKTDSCKLSDVFEYFLKKKCPFVTNEYPHIVISKEAYRYIFAIIKFDTDLIDAEILPSLIYRMADNDEAGLFGYQTSLSMLKRFCSLYFLARCRKGQIHPQMKMSFR